MLVLQQISNNVIIMTFRKHNDINKYNYNNEICYILDNNTLFYVILTHILYKTVLFAQLQNYKVFNVSYYFLSQGFLNNQDKNSDWSAFTSFQTSPIQK